MLSVLAIIAKPVWRLLQTNLPVKRAKAKAAPHIPSPVTAITIQLNDMVELVRRLAAGEPDDAEVPTARISKSDDPVPTDAVRSKYADIRRKFVSIETAVWYCHRRAREADSHALHREVQACPWSFRLWHCR